MTVESYSVASRRPAGRGVSMWKCPEFLLVGPILEREIQANLLETFHNIHNRGTSPLCRNRAMNRLLGWWIILQSE